jgi:hypothetical protein
MSNLMSNLASLKFPTKQIEGARNLDFDGEPTFIDMLVNSGLDTLVILAQCGVINHMEAIQIEGLAKAGIEMCDLQEALPHNDLPKSKN